MAGLKASGSVKLDGLDTATRGLLDAQPQLKKATAPVLQSIAAEINRRAKAGVNVYHPRNLFRAKGKGGARLSPSYRTKKAGEFWWVVRTPSTEVGSKEAMAEFMAASGSPQGAALVRALNSVYRRAGGSGGGRILYKTRDEIDAEATAKLEAAVAEAAKKIEEEVNGG